MTEPAQLALIAAIVPTIAALATLVVAVLNGFTSKENKRIGEETLKQTAAVSEKATEIHTLTNGSLSKVQAALDVARSEISGLKDMVANMTAAKYTADELARVSVPAAPKIQPAAEVKVVNTDAIPVKEAP